MRTSPCISQTEIILCWFIASAFFHICADFRVPFLSLGEVGSFVGRCWSHCWSIFQSPGQQYIYIYIYIDIYIGVCICTYIYIEREREREGERDTDEKLKRTK